MSGYANYDGGYYPNDDDPLDGLANNDPNDDFDPLELLHSPLFDENRGGNSGGRGGGRGGENNNGNMSHSRNNNHNSNSSNQNANDYSTYSGQQQQGMPPGMDSSQASHASAPPYIGGPGNFVPQGAGSGSGGYPNQFGGGMASGNMNAGNNMNANNRNPNNRNPNNMNPNGMPSPNMSSMPSPNMSSMGNGGIPTTINAPGMNNNFGMSGGGGGGGNQMGGGMQGGGMNMNNVNPAALNQMSQLQGMQQALQMQQQGNSMQGGGGGGNPMVNMQSGGGPMPGGQLRGPNPNVQGMGSGMQNVQGGMNTSMNRNGSLNNSVSNLQGSMSGLNMSGHGHQNVPTPMSNMGGQSFPPQQRGGSLPTSPNAMPTLAQMNASIRAGNSSRSGGRTRGPTPKVDMNGKVIANTSTDPGINEAMEKLCESMRRSAMSRNLVKQLSGRSVQRSGSARSLSRSNSGGMRKQQMLGRSLSGGLPRGDDGSGRGTPTRTVPIRRLSNSKHRLHARAPPGHRGAFRTNSMGSQASVHSQGGNTFLQLDDQSLGAL